MWKESFFQKQGRYVSAHEYEKFKETFDRHECVPRSGLYLADGYDIVHSYTDGTGN